MTIYTFHIDAQLSKILGISPSNNKELSDQYLTAPTGAENENYATYGGGASGRKNGHFGCKHSDEAKEKMRQKALGRRAPNKGVPNPKQREKMLADNPMKNPEIAKKVSEKNKGRTPHNKGNKSKPKTRPQKPTLYGKDGRKKTLWSFLNGENVIVEDTRAMCDKLGLSFSSVRHKIGKGPYIRGKYKGLSINRFDYISQDPLVQLSS